MKIRPSILLLCVAAIAVVILAIVWRGKKPALPTAETATTNAVAIKSVPPSLLAPAKRIAPLASNAGNPSSPSVGNPGQMSGPGTTGNILNTQNTVPIVFYGRLEDQFGNPVAGAEVKGTTRIDSSQTNGYGHFATVSDANGLFTFNAGMGARLFITPEKAGYALASMNTDFKYSHMFNPNYFVPNPNAPVVINMWKLQGAQPLVDISQTYRLPYTGEPIFFDLVDKKVVSSGGALEAIITRAPGIITQRKEDHRDWSIKLVPVEGGIMEPEGNTASVTFEAPADGYQDSYLLQMQQDDPAWFDNIIQKDFFLKSRNGQVYSKFSFDFKINDDPNGLMYFQFRGVANTNGSRNWEATAPQEF